MKTIAVDKNGTPHEITNKPMKQSDIFAKSSDGRYFVLASNAGDLFDVSDANNNIHKKDRKRGEMFWELRKCSKECYDSYTIFLKSKNRTPFILAQRSFRNDF